jgi:hypothetical protein
MSTALPRLAKGEPGCPDITRLSDHARDVLLSAARGSLRRAGLSWYGPDKTRPFLRTVVHALIRRGHLSRVTLNHTRITTRGRWLARTICSQGAGDTFHTITGRPDRAQP